MVRLCGARDLLCKAVMSKEPKQLLADVLCIQDVGRVVQLPFVAATKVRIGSLELYRDVKPRFRSRCDAADLDLGGSYTIVHS